MKKQKISIGIVTNRKEMVTDTLESIKSQSVKPYEVIIVENNRTKTLQPVIDKYAGNMNFRYFLVKQGIAAGRNKVLENAKGDIISFIDDDCILSLNWIKNISEIMSDTKVVGILGKFGNYYNKYFFAKLEQLLYDSWLRQYIKINVKSNLPSGIFINTRNFSIKRKIIRKYNLRFKPNAPFKIEDTDFGIRLFESLRPQESVVYAPKAYLLHKNSVSLTDFLNRRKVSREGVAWLKQRYPGYIENTPKIDNSAFEKLQKKSITVWLLFFIERQVIRLKYLISEKKFLRLLPPE